MTLNQNNTLEQNHQIMLSSGERPAAAPERNNLSLRDVALIIYRRRMLATGIFAGIFFTVAAVTMLMPSIYVAKAKLMFKKERINNVVSPSEGPATEIKPQLTEEVLNSEIEILSSSYLLRAVIQRAGLQEILLAPLAGKSLEGKDSLEIAAVFMKKTLETQIVPKSNIIQVSYESEDPRLAVKIVNELCRLYVDRHLEVHESKGAYLFFQKEANALLDTLQATAAALRAFEIENGLISPEKQRELLLQQIAEYENQLNVARAGAQSSAQQVAFLEKQIASAPQNLQAQSQEITATVQQAMLKQLADLRVQHDLVAQGEKRNGQAQSRLAHSMKARIAQMEEALQRSENSPTPDVSGDINRTVAELSTELTRARFTHIGYQTQERGLAGAVGEMRHRLKNLENATLTHDELQRRLQLQQSNYLLYAKKQEEARISEALDREKVANVSVIDPASTPITPIRPNRKLNLLLGCVLALMVSLGTAFMLGYNDSLLRASNDFERQLPIALIATIPEGHWPPELLLEENTDADGGAGR
ncbi:MAG: GumC family protein [bacterium]